MSNPSSPASTPLKSDGREPKPFRLPIQVLVYCYRRSAGRIEYLMLRRTAKYGAFWQGVTGAPEGDESLLEGASRELMEETQLSPETIHQVDFSYSFPVQDDWKWAYHPGVTKIDEFVFLAEMLCGVEPILSFEHDRFEWAHFEQAMTLLKWPNNRDALQFCHQLLHDARSHLC